MNKARILVVDDEVGFTRLLQLNLHWTGRYVVRAENSGTAALAALREFHPDLILLDVMMPGMDGGDLAARLQHNPRTRGIPIVFVTAAVRKTEARGHAGQIGGLNYIAKPVELDELIRCIDHQVATHPAPSADNGTPAPADCRHN
jgi:CheY-like chemotaxis protein